MRTVVIFLLLANLTFFAFTRLDATSEGEAVRLVEQVQPEKIKLLTPQQVAALGPAKVAALADVCLEFGPLTEADRARALADLESLALGKLLTQKRIETTTSFWVYLPPAPEQGRGRSARRRSAHPRARRRGGRRRGAAAQCGVARAVSDGGRREQPARRSTEARRGECESRTAPAGDRELRCS